MISVHLSRSSPPIPSEGPFSKTSSTSTASLLALTMEDVASRSTSSNGTSNAHAISDTNDRNTQGGTTMLLNTNSTQCSESNLHPSIETSLVAGSGGDGGHNVALSPSSSHSLMTSSKNSIRCKEKTQSHQEAGCLHFDRLDLYGREYETSILLKQLNASMAGDRHLPASEASPLLADHHSAQGRQLVLLSGTSGSGKTRLAEVLKPAIHRRGGIWTRGKFDQKMRNRPYSAIATSCNQLCRQILTRKNVQVDGHYEFEQVEKEDCSVCTFPLLHNGKNRQITNNKRHLGGSRSLQPSSSPRDQSKNSRRYDFRQICEDIRENLGQELKLLTRIIPGLSQLLFEGDSRPENAADLGLLRDHEDLEGSYSSSAPLPTAMAVCSSSMDSKNQFHFAFLRFIRVIVGQFPPVVMVLDDLQWADSSSMDLLEVLLSDRQIRSGFMVIAIYRSNEVDSTHPFRQCIRDLTARSQEQDFALTQMEISDLSVDSVINVVQDLLHRDDASTVGLAQICYDKTTGNPFFLLEYIAMLHKTGLLQYNQTIRDWTWEEEEIDRQTKSCDNVIDLLMIRITELSPLLLDIVQVAACLGSTFEVPILSTVISTLHDPTPEDKVEEKISTVTHALETLEKQRYICKARLDGSTASSYRWIHDRVQEAALETIPESQRAQKRKQVGEILVAELNDEELDAAVFVVVNLFVECQPQQLDTTERIRLARLHSIATRKTMEVSAFGSAAQYASKGIQLLPENSWTNNYELCLRLYTDGARAEGAVGNIEAMEFYCNAILSQENMCLEDQLDAYHTWIDSLANRENIDGARRLILTLLSQFNCQFPTNALSTKVRVFYHLMLLKARIKALDPSKLSSMRDYRSMQLMKLLDKLWTCFLLLNDDNVALVTIRMLHLTTKYGYCPTSPPSFALTGILMTGVYDDLQSGALCGRHALDLLLQLDSTQTSARTIFLVHTFLYPWTEPLKNMLRPLMRAYDTGLRSGDTESATWAILNWLQNKLLTGAPLGSLETDIVQYSIQMKALKREQAYRFACIIRQAVLNLLGKNNQDDPTNFVGDGFSQADWDEMPEDSFWMPELRFNQGLLFTYFGEHEKQVEMIQQYGHDYLMKAVMAGAENMPDTFVKGVSCFVLAQKTRKRRYFKLGQVFRAKIRKWLAKGNPNMKHYHALLEAQVLAYKGKFHVAKHQYEIAVSEALQAGFCQDAALANEMLGDFLLSQGSKVRGSHEGTECLKKASKQWENWGAQAKVLQLEQKYPEIFKAKN